MSNYDEDYRKVKISFGKSAKTYHAWYADVEKEENEDLTIGKKYNCAYNGKEYKMYMYHISYFVMYPAGQNLFKVSKIMFNDIFWLWTGFSRLGS